MDNWEAVFNAVLYEYFFPTKKKNLKNIQNENKTLNFKIFPTLSLYTLYIAHKKW